LWIYFGENFIDIWGGADFGPYSSQSFLQTWNHRPPRLKFLQTLNHRPLRLKFLQTWYHRPMRFKFLQIWNHRPMRLKFLQTWNHRPLRLKFLQTWNHRPLGIKFLQTWNHRPLRLKFLQTWNHRPLRLKFLQTWNHRLLRLKFLQTWNHRPLGLESTYHNNDLCYFWHLPQLPSELNLVLSMQFVFEVNGLDIIDHWVFIYANLNLQMYISRWAIHNNFSITGFLKKMIFSTFFLLIHVILDTSRAWTIKTTDNII
jgi:hypothetical protein